MIYKRGSRGLYWYKFSFAGRTIRETTKQTNPRIARQMEAAHKTALAKGEVGIRDKIPVPTLTQFAEADFLPFIRANFSQKPRTLEYYLYGLNSLLACPELADRPLDRISADNIAAFAARMQARGLQVATMNRQLQVLRRMFNLAIEWGKVERLLPKVRMLPGERHRERVVSPEEEERFLQAAPPLLRDVAILMLDCGLRPEECFRLRWEDFNGATLQVQHGKTAAARRKIPLPQRVQAILEMRRGLNDSDWVFPAPTRSGHIEGSSLRKQLARAFRSTAVVHFELYCLRHTCLTRWAPHMDPWTLGYLAGHTDMAVTKRYVHPQEPTIRAAMERAGGHKFGHRPDNSEFSGPALSATTH